MPIQVQNFEKESMSIACGKHHTLILTTLGLVYACGSNVEG